MGRQIVGAQPGLMGLDPNQGLKVLWTLEDKALADGVSLIAEGDRVLAATRKGELWLLQPREDRVDVLARVPALEGHPELCAHPAVAGQRLFLRDRAAVRCLDLGAGTPVATR